MDVYSYTKSFISITSSSDQILFCISNNYLNSTICSRMKSKNIYKMFVQSCPQATHILSFGALQHINEYCLHTVANGNFLFFTRHLHLMKKKDLFLCIGN